jgi:hypothetical protein
MNKDLGLPVEGQRHDRNQWDKEVHRSKYGHEEGAPQLLSGVRKRKVSTSFPVGQMIELVEKGEECFRQEAVMGLGSL